MLAANATTLRYVYLVVGLGLAGCNTLVGPDRGDPAQFAFQTAVQFACRQWSPARPATSLGLFDVFLRYNPAEDRVDGPTDAQVRTVLRAGATIVHRFNFPAVRAILPISRIPDLAADVVRGVVDPQLTEVRVAIGFHQRIESDWITALGGRVTHTFSNTPTVFAIVPDASIPALRIHPGVRYVEQMDGGGCFGQD